MMARSFEVEPEAPDEDVDTPCHRFAEEVARLERLAPGFHRWPRSSQLAGRFQYQGYSRQNVSSSPGLQ